MTRLALIFLPVLACAGALLPVFGQLFAFRLAVLVVCFIATLVLLSSSVRSRLLAAFAACALLWLLDATLLLSFIKNFTDGFLEVLAVMIGLAFVLSLITIIAARPAQHVLRFVAQGWLIAYLVCAAVAVWELVTSKHVRNYVTPSYYVNPGHYPDIASIMSNPNQYGFFLCASFSFILYLYMASSRRLIRMFLGLTALSSFYFIYAANCRFGIVCLGIQFLLWLGAYRSGAVRLIKLAIGCAMLGLTGVLLLGLAVPQALFRQGNLVENVVVAFEQFTQSGSSANVRTNLFVDGVILMVGSGFVGVGPAGYELALRAGLNQLPNYGIYSPHSAIAEIGSQYGLIVLVLFFLVLVQWYRTARQAVRVATDEVTRRAGRVVMIGLISLVPASWLNSGFLKPSISWMLLASLAVFAVYCEQVVATTAPCVAPVDRASMSRRRSAVLSHGDRSYLR